MKLEMIILAAGKGTRMHSSLPKVLNTLGGKTLLKHVIDTCHALDSAEIHVVYGYQGEQLRQHLADETLHWVKQEEQLGTGHAVLQTLPQLQSDSKVIILYGDVPLISVETLRHLVESTPAGGLGIVTAFFHNPDGYGRIIRNAANEITGIIEEKDATEAERAIKEINTGIYCLEASLLRKWLSNVKPHNAQKEYYITDIVKFAAHDHAPIHSVNPLHHEEVLGVNDRVQLAHLERCYQHKQAESLMRRGVRLLDPARLDIRGEISVGRDVVIDVNVILEGTISLGDDVTIGAHSILKNVSVASGVTIKSHCVIEDAVIEADAVIGPFARVRPGTVLGRGSHVGNFVEIKKSTIGDGSKVNHLSYIGDAVVGEGVNIGAGTITCNYDGVHKHPTTIGNHAFIGSGTELVAPVSVGAGSYIGAGSTITQDTPAGQLTVARARQVTISGWEPPKKEEK